MLEFLFWLSVAGVAYTYAGYPAVVWLAASLRPRPVRKGPGLPSVSLLIAAHNEGRVIGQKIENCLGIDYPPGRLEILVGTDGCRDDTDSVVAAASARWDEGDARYPVRHWRFQRRVGKPAVLNRLVSVALGEVLVFSDARQQIEPGAVRRLVENLCDRTVGAVGGELVLTGEGESPVGSGLGAYWRYEKFIRRQESRLGSTVGATGALYAVRRRLYRLLDPQTILDDVAVPLEVVRQGFRSVFEPEARAYDRISADAGEEFKRKVRTLAGNYQIFFRHKRMLLPGSGVAWQFWSHKVMRTVVPLWLAAAWASSGLLGGPFYGAAWCAQTGFYALALLGAAARGQAPSVARIYYVWGPTLRLARVAYVFCLLNASAVVGFYRFLRGAQPVTWEKAHA